MQPAPPAHDPSRLKEDVDSGPDDETLDEGCFYLSRLGLGPNEIAKRFELTSREVRMRQSRFELKVKSGDLVESESDKSFWSDVMKEAEGNVKVTFVTEKGFHHAWRSELEKLDPQTLFAIFESCKHFLDLDPSSRLLEYSPPKNYDPLAMQREIRKAVIVMGALIDDRWKRETSRTKGG